MRTGLIIAGSMLGGLLVTMLLVGTVFGGTYNTVVTKNNGVDNQWAKVESDYQRRLDLVPNLVAIVKGSQKQELAVYGTLAQKYAEAFRGARTIDEKVTASNGLTSVYAGFAGAINLQYPELKSQATIARLMDELAGTENRIAVERNRYNDTATNYNTYVSQFPTNMVIGVVGRDLPAKRNLFKSAEEAKSAPQVDLSKP